MTSYVLSPARSLGSVALRKAEALEGGVHLNVFTIDFNEELVALYGGSLRRQTHFLHESIKAILRLYKVYYIRKYCMSSLKNIRYINAN